MDLWPHSVGFISGCLAGEVRGAGELQMNDAWPPCFNTTPSLEPKYRRHHPENASYTYDALIGTQGHTNLCVASHSPEPGQVSIIPNPEVRPILIWAPTVTIKSRLTWFELAIIGQVEPCIQVAFLGPASPAPLTPQLSLQLPAPHARRRRRRGRTPACPR